MGDGGALTCGYMGDLLRHLGLAGTQGNRTAGRYYADVFSTGFCRFRELSLWGHRGSGAAQL
jgi:hypothetical protein